MYNFVLAGRVWTEKKKHALSLVCVFAYYVSIGKIVASVFKIMLNMLDHYSATTCSRFEYLTCNSGWPAAHSCSAQL